MSEEVNALLHKAARSLNAAERLLVEGDADFAASRAYYGYFYVAEALLLDEGLSYSTHGAVIGEYGRLFARTEILDRRFHRLLNSTFAARQAADYDTDFGLGRSQIQEFIEEGRNFLDSARDYLDKDTEQGKPTP